MRCVRVTTKNGDTTRPILKLYPLEVTRDEIGEDSHTDSHRERRQANVKARENIRKWISGGVQTMMMMHHEIDITCRIPNILFKIS